MVSKISNEQKLAAADKLRGEMMRYFDLFRLAFDELHDAVVKHLSVPGHYVGRHHDYPIMSLLDNGFPSFSEVGIYDDNAPRDYVGSIRPRGLGDILGGRNFPEISFPRGVEFATFLRDHKFGKRLSTYGELTSNYRIERMLDDAVDRYLNIYGTDININSIRRDNIIRQVILGTLSRRLNLRLIVPICMTHFDVDHFSLTKTSYIVRLPKRMQLARARMGTLGTGAVQMVVGAATHAFVSKDWHLDVDDIYSVDQSLTQPSANLTDAIDSFFGALRVATGVSTGYAQILWMPKKWALEYFCDLPPIYGTSVRYYPNDYDNYGWTRPGKTITAGQLKEVRRIYNSVLANKSEAVWLALKRLNGCLIRTDAADAILDGTIGLELLLGDDQNQSLSYKLRLRVAALAILGTGATPSPKEMASKVKRLYEARSAIVHGRRKKLSRQASEPLDTSHHGNRTIASDLLRFVLDVLMAHPEYQQPSRIDEGLLLRDDDITSIREAVVARPKRNRKDKRSV